MSLRIYFDKVVGMNTHSRQFFLTVAFSVLSGALCADSFVSDAGLTCLGELAPRPPAEIAGENWTLGCECLDRDFADFSQYREYIPPLGIKRVRLQAGWAKCEPAEGKWNFVWLDEIVDWLNAHDIGVLLELSYGNPIYPGAGGWDLASGMPNTPDGLAHWDVWVEKLVTHFKGRVDHYAMWNEPYNRNNTAEQVADMNVRSAKIIRRILPNAVIAGLSLGQHDAKTLEACLKPMGKDAELFDYFIYHGYQIAPETSYPDVEEMKALLPKYAPKAKLWQCENGCPSEMPSRFALKFVPWTEISQAKWNLRRMLGDLGHDVKSSVFTVCDFNHRGREINRKGIIRANAEKKVIGLKKSWYAVRNTVGLFDARVKRVADRQITTVDHTLELYQYTAANGSPMFVYWQSKVEPDNDPAAENGKNDFRYQRPGDSLATRPAVLEWTGHPLKDPVLIDLMSGRVYELPETIAIVHSCGTSFVNVPVYDSPCVITERVAVQLNPTLGKSR